VKIKYNYISELKRIQHFYTILCICVIFVIIIAFFRIEIFFRPSPLPHTASTIPALFHRPDPHADLLSEFVCRIGILFAQGGEEDVGAGEGIFEGVVVGEGELEVVGDGVELVVFEMGPCFRGDFVGAEVAGRGVWDAVE